MEGVHGSTVTFDESLWSGTEMSAVMLMRSHQDDALIKYASDRHVEIGVIVPLHKDELSSVKSLGVDQVLEVWENEGVEYWDPFRSPSNALVSACNAGHQS